MKAKGLEPLRYTSLDPKSNASTKFRQAFIFYNKKQNQNKKILEFKGIEPLSSACKANILAI